MRITDTGSSQKNDLRIVEWESLEDFHTCVRRVTYHCPDKNLSHLRDVMRGHLQQEAEVNNHWRYGDYGKDGVWWNNTTTHPNVDEFVERYRKFGAGEYLGESMHKRRHRVFSEDDGDYIFERAGSDRPFESQRFHQEVSQRRGQIDVLCEFGGNCGLSNDQLENAGFAACALCDRLESDGFRVRIIGGYYSSDEGGAAGGPTIRTMILKHHDEPLDIGRVGLVLACGPFYRCAVFRAIILTTRQTYSTLGTPAKVSMEQFKHLDLSPTVILVPRMLSKEAAIAFVKQQTGKMEVAA